MIYWNRPHAIKKPLRNIAERQACRDEVKETAERT